MSSTDLRTSVSAGDTRSKPEDGLSNEEIRILRESKEEYKRRGRFVRIYPTPESWELHSKVVQHYVMLCYVMLCYVMLCYVMLCYVMLCCYVVMLLCCYVVMLLCCYVVMLLCCSFTIIWIIIIRFLSFNLRPNCLQMTILLTF